MKTLALTLLLFSHSLFAQYNNGEITTGNISSNQTPAPNGYTFSELQYDEATNDTNSQLGIPIDDSFDWSATDDFYIPNNEIWEISNVKFYIYLPNHQSEQCPISSYKIYFKENYNYTNTTNRTFTCEKSNVLRVHNSNMVENFEDSMFVNQIWEIFGQFDTVVLDKNHYDIIFQVSSPSPLWVHMPFVTILNSRGNPMGNIAYFTPDAGTSGSFPIYDYGYNNTPVGQDLPFIINYNSILGNEEQIRSLDNRISFSPNPVNNYLQIFVPDSFDKTQTTISVYALTGEKMMEFYDFMEKYDLSSLRPGNYIIIISDKKFMTSSKLIKR